MEGEKTLFEVAYMPIFAILGPLEVCPQAREPSVCEAFNKIIVFLTAVLGTIRYFRMIPV